MFFSRWWQLKYFLFSTRFWGFHDPIWLAHMFQMGWFNHLLGSFECVLLFQDFGGVMCGQRKKTCGILFCVNRTISIHISLIQACWIRETNPSINVYLQCMYIIRHLWKLPWLAGRWTMKSPMKLSQHVPIDSMPEILAFADPSWCLPHGIFTEVDYLAKTICHGGLLLCPWAFDCGAPYVTYLEAPYVTLKQSTIEMNRNDKTCTNILWVVVVSSGGNKGEGLLEKPTRAIWVLSFCFQGYLLFVSNVHSDFDEPFLCVNSGCSSTIYAGDTPERCLS